MLRLEDLPCLLRVVDNVSKSQLCWKVSNLLSGKVKICLIYEYKTTDHPLQADCNLKPLFRIYHLPRNSDETIHLKASKPEYAGVQHHDKSFLQSVPFHCLHKINGVNLRVIHMKRLLALKRPPAQVSPISQMISS